MKSLIDLYAESFVKNMPKRHLKKFSKMNYNQKYKILSIIYDEFEKEIKNQFIKSVIILIDEMQEGEKK